jgi:hypothetical protein
VIPWLLTQLGASEELREQPWRLAFERPAPPWLWVVGLLVVGGAAAYSYAGVRGPRTARAALASLRAATLLLIAWLAMLPVIEWPRERTDPDHVEVLIDRSGSMRTPRRRKRRCAIRCGVASPPNTPWTGSPSPEAPGRCRAWRIFPRPRAVAR